MGNMRDKNKDCLSPSLYEDIMSVFKKIDTDGSKTIDKEETLKYWLKKVSKFFKFFNRKGNFSKLNTDELFKAVDTDNSGDISEDEWITFWEQVKKSGYTDQAIREEIESLLAGEAWVQFDTTRYKRKKSKTII